LIALLDIHVLLALLRQVVALLLIVFLALPALAEHPTLAYKVHQVPGGTIATFEGWSVRPVNSSSGMLVIDNVPPEPREFLLRTIISTPTAQEMANLFTLGPQVVQQLLSRLGTFQRDGEQRQITMGGDEGAVETYAGTVNGAPMTVRALYVKRGDVAIAVLGLGTRSGSEKYGASVEIMAQSITFQESPVEAELAGGWVLETSARVEGTTPSDVLNVSSTRVITIYPNGLFTDTAGSTFTGSASGAVEGADRGKLIKRGGALTFHYDNGNVWTTTYRLEGGALRLDGKIYLRQ